MSSGSAWWRCARSCGGSIVPMRAICWLLPTRWCARAFGFWAATDGRLTSDSADWTTCLGSGKNVNVLVLDTEVYSNTGGQMSKATPRGAVAKFAASGKPNSRKDLAMEAVSYGSVYVAQVALGGNDSHVVKAFQEAEAHEGPSIIIAYSSCIAHGYDLVHGLEQQKLAVQSGYWPLMRYNPALREEGQESLPAGFEGAFDPAEGLHLSRGALHDAGAQQSGAGCGVAEGSTGRRGAAVARILGAGNYARPQRDAEHRSLKKSLKRKLAAVAAGGEE